jgi:hypothetical protein
VIEDSIAGRERALDSGASAGPTVAVWAILIGAFISCALSLFLLALGAGLGLSASSPWPGSGISGHTAGVATGIFLAMTALLASTLGGYITGYLRTGASKPHTDEVYFRDTVNGLATWATATLLTVAFLSFGGLAALNAAAPVATGQNSESSVAADPVNAATDILMRDGGKTQLNRIIASAVGGHELTSNERSYADGIVASRWNVSPQEADKRLTDTIAEARAKADEARKAARSLALWSAISLLIGALAASFAAAEGGKMRDGGLYLGMRRKPLFATERSL